MKLIERYPDRFMFGSDVVGIVSGMDRALRPYDKLLKALVLPKVAHDNFANLSTLQKWLVSEPPPGWAKKESSYLLLTNSPSRPLFARFSGKPDSWKREWKRPHRNEKSGRIGKISGDTKCLATGIVRLFDRNSGSACGWRNG